MPFSVPHHEKETFAVKQQDDTDTSADRQPDQVALSNATRARGRVLYMGDGTRTKPSQGHAYVTIEVPISELSNVRLYSDVEIVADREATL